MVPGFALFPEFDFVAVVAVVAVVVDFLDEISAWKMLDFVHRKFSFAAIDLSMPVVVVAVVAAVFVAVAVVDVTDDYSIPFKAC